MFEKLFELIARWAEHFRCWTIVDPYEGGLVLRLGVFQRELKPGFNWTIPLFERVITEHTVPRTAHIHSMSTTTKDGRTIGFEAIVTWKIKDLQKSLLEVSELKDAIADCCMGVIGTELSDATWDDILHGKTVDSLTTACRKNGWKWGVEVIRVQLTGVAPVKNLRLLQDVYGAGLTVNTAHTE